MIRKIAILGAGAFGELMIRALASPEEKSRGAEVIATHRRPERRAELEQRYGIDVLADNREACENADMLYPVVRPEQTMDLMKEIGPCIKNHQLLATGAAPLGPSFYRQFLPSKCALAWVFPTPFITMRSGFLAICPEPGTAPERLTELKEYWGRFCDEIVLIGEDAMDAFVILHASGSIYLWPIVKAFVQFGAEHGFSMEQAQGIVLSTFQCGARSLKGRSPSPAALEQLMSEYSVPGSLTEAGIQVLKQNHVESLYSQALEAARVQAGRHRHALGNSPEGRE